LFNISNRQQRVAVMAAAFFLREFTAKTHDRPSRLSCWSMVMSAVYGCLMLQVIGLGRCQQWLAGALVAR